MMRRCECIDVIVGFVHDETLAELIRSYLMDYSIVAINKKIRSYFDFRIFPLEFNSPTIQVIYSICDVHLNIGNLTVARSDSTGQIIYSVICPPENAHQELANIADNQSVIDSIDGPNPEGIERYFTYLSIHVWENHESAYVCHDK